MADSVSSSQYATILMFVVYFARNSADIVKRLVANADRIYAKEAPANLETDVAFLNQLCEHPDVEIPEEIDVAKAREEQRELNDRIERSAKALPGRGSREIVYNDDLSDTDKFDLAYTHIGLLGQVIRNFPGSLPGPEKLAILKSTYLLGLRVLRVLLAMLSSTATQFRKDVGDTLTAERRNLDPERVRKLVDLLMVLISRMCTFSVIKHISGSVGVADLEDAYQETLRLVGENSASWLIDASVKLDHSSEFPATEIRNLHKQFASNAFADTVLSDLVRARMMVVDLDRRTRQSMVSLFKLQPNDPMLLDTDTKKS